MPQTDFIKLIASVLVAVVGAIGGVILIVWVFFNGGDRPGVEGLTALIGGWIAWCLQYLFNLNTTAAIRAQTRSDLLDERMRQT